MKLHSLRNRILLLTLAPLVITAFFIAAHFTRERLAHYSHDIQQSAQSIASHLAPSAANEILAGDRRAMLEQLRSTISAPSITSIVITDAQDRVFARATKLSVAPDNPLSRYLLTTIHHHRQPIYAPGETTGAPLGWISIELSTTGAANRQLQVFLEGIFFTLLTVIVTGLIAIRLTRNITEPVHNLTMAVKRFEMGDLHYRVPSYSSGELGELEQGVNKMADTLQRAIDRDSLQMSRLHEVNLELETQVEEQSRIKEALLQSDRQLKSVLAAIPDVMLVLDKAGDIRKVFATDSNILLLPDQEQLAWNIHDLLPEDPAARVKQAVLESLESGKLNECDYSLSGRDGMRYFSARIVRFTYDFEPCALLVARDISELKKTELALVAARNQLESRVRERTSELQRTVNQLQKEISHREQAQQALRESEARWRSLTAASGDYIILVDLEGTILYTNQTLPELKREAVIGTPIFNHIEEDQTRVIKSTFKKILKTGKPDSFETRYLHPDGRCSYFESIVSPVAEDDLIAGYVLSARDITLRHQVEDDLKTAKELAEKANAAKSDFLAVMSHELRSPLNVILGMSRLLLKSDLNAQQHDDLDVIVESASELLRLISDMLDFARLEAGKISIDNEPFQLRALISETVHAHENKAREKGLELHLDFEDMPDNVTGDAGRIRQVIHNLIENAIKFSTEGTITISANIIRDDASLVTLQVTVIDQGLGIPEDKTPLIFNKFTQVDSSHSRRYGGAGLGLAICKELVELMGGHIGVQSKAGQGTAFWFNLPLVLTASTSAQNTAPEKPLDKHLKVLVVEDIDKQRKIVQRLLENIGCEVDVAENGLQALEKDIHYYDLILMDIAMPEMDGYQLAEKIRQRESGKVHIPIVALTAHAMPEDRERCLNAGMDDHITKPVDLGTLRNILERWAPGSREAIH
jgi:PAS domain S-box-containing protein